MSFAQFFIAFWITLLIQTNVLAIEDRFEGLDLRTGKVVSVDVTSSDIFIAYFLSSSCPCSQAHFDHLNLLQQKYPRYRFIGFHSSKTIDKKSAMSYFSKFLIKFPILQDNELKFANQFNALKTPHVFVYAKGNDIPLFQGGATNSRNPKNASQFYLQNALSQIAKGEVVTTKIAKTLGCYIQR